jgi:hypothetical protein
MTDVYFRSAMRGAALPIALVLATCAGTPPPGNSTAGVVANNYDEFDGAFSLVAGDSVSRAAVFDRGCHIDQINGTMAADAPLDHGGVGRFKGWVGNSSTGIPPKTFQVLLEGKGRYAAEGRTGDPRLDVAKFRKRPNLATSGFHLDARMSEVPVGRYHVVLVYMAAGRRITCDSGFDVQVE